MTYSEMIKELSLNLDLSQAETKRLLKSSMKVIVDILDEDIGITLPGLGTFSSYYSKRRKSFNPHHGQYMLLPPKRLLKFRASSSMKDEVNN